jgi:hypothetical protein
MSLISKYIPGNEEESRHMLFIFKQYYKKKKFSVIDHNSDSDNEEGC